MDGVRDPRMVESALARPANLARTGAPTQPNWPPPTPWNRQEHGFLDGNKRTGWVTARPLLADDGRRLEFDPIAAIRTV